jgi:hypothetical protein
MKPKPVPWEMLKGSVRMVRKDGKASSKRSQEPETYKPRSGLFLFQASQAMESSQRPIMAE